MGLVSDVQIFKNFLKLKKKFHSSMIETENIMIQEKDTISREST